jgi:hypothetical protein
MSTAPGLGKQVSTVKIIGPGVLRALILRAPGAFPLSNGGVDTAGRSMHVKYTASRVLDAQSNLGEVPIVTKEEYTVEFDGEDYIMLPDCGNVVLTGGSGEYIWELSSRKLNDREFYQPTLHHLTTYVNGPTRFIVPKHHTLIGTWNRTVVCTDVVTGSNVTLGAYPIPIVSGTELFVPNNVVLFTAWRG